MQVLDSVGEAFRRRAGSSAPLSWPGYCRMARLHAFAQYVHLYYGERNVSSASHRLVAVPGVGHSGCAMFQSAEFTDAVLLSSQARA